MDSNRFVHHNTNYGQVKAINDYRDKFISLVQSLPTSGDEAAEGINKLEECCFHTNACIARNKEFFDMSLSETIPASPILKYFAYKHLPEKLQVVSQPLGELAEEMDRSLPPGPEKSAGLRKLLEAKDCLVRAALEDK